jgi:hypothetical protein
MSGKPFKYNDKNFKLIPNLGNLCDGCYGYTDSQVCKFVNEKQNNCNHQIAVLDVQVVEKQKNEYIVVRRINIENTDEDWDEFTQTVTAYMNMGYSIVGGVSITHTGKNITVGQAMAKVKSPSININGANNDS